MWIKKYFMPFLPTNPPTCTKKTMTKGALGKIYDKGRKLTDFLKELLNVDGVSGAGLNKNSCDWFCKFLCFFHGNFPVKHDESHVDKVQTNVKKTQKSTIRALCASASLQSLRFVNQCKKCNYRYIVKLLRMCTREAILTECSRSTHRSKLRQSHRRSRTWCLLNRSCSLLWLQRCRLGRVPSAPSPTSSVSGKSPGQQEDITVSSGRGFHDERTPRHVIYLFIFIKLCHTVRALGVFRQVSISRLGKNGTCRSESRKNNSVWFCVRRVVEGWTYQFSDVVDNDSSSWPSVVHGS